jgi:Cu/Ag efflux protein CusF
MTRSRLTWIILLGVVIVAAGVIIVVRSMHRTAPVAAFSRHPLTGVVMRVDPEKKTVSVANDNIPGFMEPMVMDYKVDDTATLARLHRRDEVQATLLSNGQEWRLEDVTITTQH